mgnify:CR=1 FL=1
MTAFGASCPHCETLFKVFPDQLRLHNGFANCGACGRTFDVQAVLLALPAHETSFLERNNPFVGGLPVLNAVVHATRRPPANAAQNSPTPVSQASASLASEATQDKPTEPKLTQAANEPAVNKPIHTIQLDNPSPSSIPAGKLPILSFPERGTSGKAHNAVPQANEHTRAIKKPKWWVFPILLILFLLVVVALAQPEEARALANELKQKLVQFKSLSEFISPSFNSILSAMGIHG